MLLLVAAVALGIEHLISAHRDAVHLRVRLQNRLDKLCRLA
jgi:hypothetical protein